MNRRRGIWLALAVVLLALGAVLMFTGQGDEPTPEPREVEFPRKMRREDWRRAEQRRTQVVQTAAVVDAGVTAGPQRPRDPVLAALPRGKGRSAVVIEANAIRNSPIGELLLDCMMSDGGKKLDEFRKLSGVDPLQDLDRLAITDKGLVFSGNFAKARFAELLKDRVSSDYGPGARVYEQTDAFAQMKDGTKKRVGTRPAFGTWNDQLLVVGDDSDSVKEVIGQVQGGGSDESPLVSEGSTYGEMYGVLSVEQIVRMLPPDQAELGQRLKEVAEHVELHMDASSDVALVAEIRGANSDQVTDLGKSLGAALSVARLKAQADGDKDLAQLLDFAKVYPGGAGFQLELAVPLDVLKERLAFCRDERRAAEAAETTKATEPPETTKAPEATEAAEATETPEATQAREAQQ